MRIGMIGLGRMGMNMAIRDEFGGHAFVKARNDSPSPWFNRLPAPASDTPKPILPGNQRTSKPFAAYSDPTVKLGNRKKVRDHERL